MQSALSEFTKRKRKTPSRTRVTLPKAPKKKQLTRREQQIIQLVKQGCSNKEIGYRLGIAEATIKVYLSNSFKILGVHSRFEIIANCYQHLQVNNDSIGAEAEGAD